MFTVNYPLLVDHIMREARLYLEMVERLQNQKFLNLKKDALGQEVLE